MALQITRLSSIHFQVPSETGVDGNYLWKNWDMVWGSHNDAPTYSYTVFNAYNPQFQLRDDSLNTADFDSPLVWYQPYPVEVNAVNTSGGDDTHLGWINGYRGATTTYGAWSYTLLTNLFYGVSNLINIKAYDRAGSTMAITAYDNLTFDTDTADYVTGTSNTATWDGTTKKAGAGSVKIDTVASPSAVFDSQLLLELPTSSVTLTGNRRYVVSGWVYVDTTAPYVGASIGFNPKQYSSGFKILGAKVWTDGVDAVDEWVFVYSIFEPVSVTDQNIGLWLLTPPTGITQEWTEATQNLAPDMVATSVYTDEWKIVEIPLKPGVVAISEDICIGSNAAFILSAMKANNPMGSAVRTNLQAVFDDIGYSPELYFLGDWKEFEFEMRDPSSETDESGTSAFYTVQMRKIVTVRSTSLLPPWVVEYLSIMRLSDSVTMTSAGGYGINLVATDDDPEVRWDDRTAMAHWSGKFYVLAYPWGTKD